MRSPGGAAPCSRSYHAAYAATAVGRVGKIRSAPTFSTRPPASSDVAQVLLDPSHREDGCRSSDEAARSSSSASIAVRSTSLIASALSRSHSTGRWRLGVGDGATGPRQEVVGVGEEERRVVAVDDEPGHLHRVGWSSMSCMPAMPGT